MQVAVSEGAEREKGLQAQVDKTISLNTDLKQLH